MHEAVKNSRDLVVLFTSDYDQPPFTRKEFTSFEAERAQSVEERHIIVLRCEMLPLSPHWRALAVFVRRCGITGPRGGVPGVIITPVRDGKAIRDR
jgi:hypothetical protein